MAMTNTPAWVTNGIEASLQPGEASSTRYPYTYAYDFLRSHADVFGIPENLTDSRAAVGRWLRESLGNDSALLLCAVCSLADAYLTYHLLVLS